MSASGRPAEAAREPGAGGLVSRRRLIRMGAAALAGGMFVMAAGFLEPMAGKQGVGRTAARAPELETPGLATLQPGTVRVKAVYFQMKELTAVDHEYLELVAPASVGDLVRVVQSNYPQFATMRLSMSILVDGQVATYATPLNQGDEVDFIPMIQGG